MLQSFIVWCIFFGTINANRNMKSLSTKSKEELMKDLFKADGLADLAKMGVRFMHRPMGLAGRTSSQNLADAKEATPGKCDPKPVCITNPLSSDLKSNDQIAYPPCINIHRCDGCCPSNEECVAIKTEDIKLKNVAVLALQNGQVAGYVGDVITVSNHTECECQCKWKNDNDCKKVNQYYVKHPYACECVCADHLFCGPLHNFDRESCSCKCNYKFTLSELSCKRRGYSWNNHLCRCDMIKTHLSVSEVEFN